MESPQAPEDILVVLGVGQYLDQCEKVLEAEPGQLQVVDVVRALLACWVPREVCSESPDLVPEFQDRLEPVGD